MRILLASTAAAAFAFAATPALGQYGGSPAEQAEGAPDEVSTAPSPDDEPMTAEDQADFAGNAAAPDDADIDPEADMEADADAAAADGGSMAGEEYALADVDADIDVDADGDADVDVDADVDPEDAGQLAPGDPDEGVEAVGDEGAPVEDGRTYCRRSDGTTGLIVGGGAGALVGREIGRDGRSYRRRGRGGGTAGAIIGGLIGAVVGSAVERSASEQNCR